MPNAAYGRFSNETQRETSLDDQLLKCRELAGKEKLDIDEALVFTDSALKGTSQHTAKRKGYQRLLAAWDAGLVDIVFADELCRLVRDLVEGSMLLERVRSTGVHVVTADGIDTRVKGWDLQWQLRLMMARQEVQSTSDRTKRTMRGVLERGGMIAAPAYGYRLDWSPLEPGQKPNGARWAIDPVESALVQEMYALRKSGLSVNRIAAQLNGRGTPPPRAHQAKGKPFWRGASVARILANSIYRGEFAYGGSAWTLHKQRKRRQKPDVTLFARPQFRLVSDELWAACNPPKRERVRSGARHLLAGLMTCGDCSQLLTIKVSRTSTTLVCPCCEQAVKVGARDAYMGYSSAEAGTRALRAVVAELVTGPFIAQFRQRLRERLDAPADDEMAKLLSQQRQLAGSYERLMQLMEDPSSVPDLVRPRLASVGNELKRVEAELARRNEQSVRLSPAQVGRQSALDIRPLLDRVLDGEPSVDEARRVLKRLVPRFSFVRRPKKGTSVFELELVPGACIADAAEGPQLDDERVRFEVTVSVGAQRPAVWQVSLKRL
ncbi:MAG: recombinase family protein [Burkholderiaceae bacterium]